MCYYNNMAKDLTSRRKSQKNYRDRKRHKLKLYLQDHPCVDCGESDLRCLDFDHRDPTTKDRNICVLVAGGSWSWNTVFQEIQKCDVRCANCHRKKTNANMVWLKEDWEPEPPALRSATIPHGTKNGYSYHRCRCDLCKAANAAYQQKYLAQLIKEASS